MAYRRRFLLKPLLLDISADLLRRCQYLAVDNLPISSSKSEVHRFLKTQEDGYCLRIRLAGRCGRVIASTPLPDGFFDNWTDGPKVALSSGQSFEFAKIVEADLDREKTALCA